MNPSYNNGNGSNAGGQPGGIFSRSDSGASAGATPGTKPGVIASGPDSADAPVNTPVAMPSKPMSLGDSGRSRISSLLGKRKMGGKSSSSAAPAAAPIMIGGNDAGGAGKSKKGLVIGAVIVIVIMIVVLVVVMMMGGGKKGSSSPASVTSTQMAKYMLFGDINSNKSFSEATVDNAEFMKVAQDGTYSEQQEFFGKAKEYINSKELKEAVIVLEELAGTGYAGALWINYLENGASSINEQLEKNNEIDVDEKYKSALTANQVLITESGKLFKEYSSASCIKDKEANDECINALVEKDGPVKTLHNTVTSSKIRVRKKVREIADDIFEKVKKIGEGTNGN